MKLSTVFYIVAGLFAVVFIVKAAIIGYYPDTEFGLMVALALGVAIPGLLGYVFQRRETAADDASRGVK